MFLFVLIELLNWMFFIENPSPLGSRKAERDSSGKGLGKRKGGSLSACDKAGRSSGGRFWSGFAGWQGIALLFS